MTQRRLPQTREMYTTNEEVVDISSGNHVFVGQVRCLDIELGTNTEATINYRLHGSNTVRNRTFTYNIYGWAHGVSEIVQLNTTLGIRIVGRW